MKVQTKLSLINPLALFCLIWFVQAIGYFFYRESFGVYESETWIVVILAVSFFSLGSFVAKFFFKADLFSRLSLNTISVNREKLNKFILIFSAVYGLLLLVVTFQILTKIQFAAGGVLDSMSQVRSLVNADFIGARSFYNLFRFYHLGITSILFLFCFLDQMKKKQQIILFILGLASALLTTSRLFLFFYVLTLIVIFYSSKKINLKQVFLCAIGFIFIFFGIAMVMKKGSEETDGFIGMLLWNVQVYLFSPLAAFNHSLKSGVITAEAMVLIPNSLKRILNDFGCDFKYRYNLMPFVNVPVRTNVYTFLFPLYHDGGKILISLGCFLLGFFHQIIYLLNLFFQNPVTVYIFSISLYPIAISFFEDAYFSSPGFVAVQAIPLLIFALYFKLGFSRKGRILHE